MYNDDEGSSSKQQRWRVGPALTKASGLGAERHRGAGTANMAHGASSGGARLGEQLQMKLSTFHKTVLGPDSRG